MQENTKPHSMTLESRSRLVISGVTDVDSFNEETVVLATQEGPLTVLGSGLKIGQLNLENGRLSVEGRIDAMSYADRREKTTLMKRMFR